MTGIKYQRDADSGLWCTFGPATCHENGNPPCTISYCEDDAREQESVDSGSEVERG